MSATYEHDYDQIVASVEVISAAVAKQVRMKEWSCDLPDDRPSYAPKTIWGWAVMEKIITVTVTPPHSSAAPLTISGTKEGCEWVAKLKEVHPCELVYEIW